MAEQSSLIDYEFTSISLYVLNQSVLTPLWKGAGIPYIGTSHGSDTSYIFNGVFPEGEITPDDQEMSKMLARSFIHFAYTGDPLSRSSSIKKFDEWPTAYRKINKEAGNMPSMLYIEVIGGPYGTSPASVTDRREEATEFGEFSSSLWLENVQQVVPDAQNSEGMESAASHARQRQIKREKLFQRCGYINSLAETLGI
ncbi:hypothetical protein AOQ84DRAFT_383251 [Glonium stellatum]|uniref:Carboxylesterase type B domain-containing protein n=1 Tax=Glonium stellatum TaxID=574774 RepID=A0A8E2EPB2_9PEZI|nr:hypothetical protein AOQ84DRAFT_383251 [Glonium stellatum]